MTPDPNIERLMDDVLVYLSWVPPGHAKDARDAWAKANAALAAVSADLEAAKAALRDVEAWDVYDGCFRDVQKRARAALAAPDPEGGAG